LGRQAKHTDRDDKGHHPRPGGALAGPWSRTLPIKVTIPGRGGILKRTTESEMGISVEPVRGDGTEKLL
jgi:hypothetical protein